MERVVVVLAFILIFAFNSIDNAISPMADTIGQSFQVQAHTVLLFISFCTGGTVAGLLFGPSLVSAFKSSRLLFWCTLLLSVTQIAFACSSSFEMGLVLRTLSGLGAGFTASVMWSLTFHGVSKAYFPAMIAVLMSARPLATALGVPLAGLLTSEFNWRLPIFIIAALTAVSGLALAWFYPSPPADLGKEAAANRPTAEDSERVSTDSNIKASTSPLCSRLTLSSFGSIGRAVIEPYIKALSVPHAVTYYLGSLINRMAYFGFYSLCGLWFPFHYKLDIKEVSLALFIIGLADCIINFFTNSIIKRFGHRSTFLVSIIFSLFLLPVFIYGQLNVQVAVGAIAVFMTLDRIYSMALVISVPDMFPSIGDKTAFGSLNTFTAWGAMSVIAALQGFFTQRWGMTFMESLLILCFAVGGAMITYIQWKTVFHKEVLDCNKQD
ncbi:MAG: MFS transporter [Candidatus Bruticola sp.]